MAWWDKATKSVKEQAEKVSFEADKMMRLRREEGAAGEIKAKLQAKLVDMGQAALGLYRSGALADPTVAGIANDIADMEGQLKEQTAKVEAIRAEQYQPATDQPSSGVVDQAPAAAPAAAVAPEPVAPAPVAAPVTPEAVAAPEPVAPAPAAAPAAPAAQPATVSCPNCQAEMPAKAAFCTECGTRLR
jgi:hypothetical protein